MPESHECPWCRSEDELSEPAAAAPFLTRLRGLLEASPQRRAGERCELCATDLAATHSHLVDVEGRSLACVCRACYLLFDHPGAAGGRYRAVPPEYRWAREMALDERLWEKLQVPVDVAFFFTNSSLGRTVAFYPSPAGATESLLALDVWREIVERHPPLAGLAADVQALLVWRRAQPQAAATFECHLVPIDACYELVGRMRRRWKGFSGGDEVWRDIDAFFAELRRRGAAAEPAAAEGRAAS